MSQVDDNPMLQEAISYLQFLPPNYFKLM